MTTTETEQTPAAPASTLPTSTLPTPAAQTWQRLVHVRAELKALKEQEDALAAALRTELRRGVYDSGVDGLPALTIRATRRFDAARATEILTGTPWWAQVSRTVVDQKAVEKLVEDEVIPSALLEACKVDGKDTVAAVREKRW